MYLCILKKRLNYARDKQILWDLYSDVFCDDHNPPHFHVRYEGEEAMIDIRDGHITGSLPRRALKLVYEWLDMHKEELMENWKRLSNSENAIKIEPLR